VTRHFDDVTLDEARTTATLVLLVVGLWVLNILARPITPFRGALFASMVGIFLLILALPGAREFYALEIPPEAALITGLCIAGGAVALLEIAWTISQHHLARPERTRRLAWRNPVSKTRARARANPDA
jgi:cation-transporting ATPase E